jgi:ATP-binding cassette subfamily B protein
MVNAQASLDDVLKLIEYEPPKLLEGEQLEFAAAITLRGVSFCYGRAGSATVLHDINLDIRRGERIGIVGPTGSGKSTLVDLLMGLLFPAGGQLRVDGAEITPQNAAAWQRHIAHVPQTIFLTDASLMENIAFAVAPGRIDRSRVEAAAQAAQIHNHIVSLPEGYQTRAGERGVKLSGGQRQRIGIARALYRQADVLVLDEATSALDDVTEERVMRGIDAIARDVTVIVIAHRLSTLKGCDRILQLERGRLVAVSTYQQLMQQRAGIGREEEVGR